MLEFLGKLFIGFYAGEYVLDTEAREKVCIHLVLPWRQMVIDCKSSFLGRR